MGTNQATIAAGTTQAQGGTTPYSRPGGPDGHPLRLANGHAVGIAAPRDGLRMRDDLLASLARLAGRGPVAEDLAVVSGRTGPSQPDRLVGCGARFLFNPGAFWGAKTGPNPTDRGKNGSKRHLITDARGTPLAIAHTAANVHDSQMAVPLVDAIPPIKQPSGGRRKRPTLLLADRAYDAEEKIRKPLRQRGIVPLIAKRNVGHGSGLGKFRYVVEVTFDWLFNHRRLRVRYEKRDDIHDAFLTLACAMICWNRIQGFC